MADTITVKSTKAPKPDGGHEVVLFERDAAHPDGEAFVAGPKPVEVGKTPAVTRLLREGALEEVKSKAASKPTPPPSNPPGDQPTPPPAS